MSEPSCSEKSTTSTVPFCATPDVERHRPVPMAWGRGHGSRPDHTAFLVAHVHLKHVCGTGRNADTGDANARTAVERLGIGRLHVVSVQRPAREVDDDADESGVVANADLRSGQARRGGSGQDLGNPEDQDRDAQKPSHGSRKAPRGPRLKGVHQVLTRARRPARGARVRPEARAVQAGRAHRSLSPRPARS